MTQTDKRISAYTDQVIHYMDKLIEYIEPAQYDYNKEVVENAVREIDDKLRFLKQKLVIEHSGVQLTSPPEKMPQSSGPRSVLCVETGVVYDSISQASEATGVNGGGISLVVRGINRRAGGYHWVAYEEAPDDTTRPTTKRRPRRIPVLCVETMKEYPSAKAAEEDTGISRNNISLAVNGKIETAGGYHWRRMPKYKPKMND